MADNASNGPLTARLNSLKTRIEQGKTERARAEATLEGLLKQKGEVEGELSALGVKPEDLDAEIERLRGQVEADLAQAEALLQGGAASPTAAAG